MARLLRVDRPSLWYHLTARGNEQRLTFRDDRDREHFLELLAQWAEQVRLRLHAYVLMANHYHLLAQTTGANLSASCGRWQKRPKLICRMFKVDPNFPHLCL